MADHVPSFPIEDNAWLVAPSRIHVNTAPDQRSVLIGLRRTCKVNPHAGTLPGLNPWVNHTDTVCRGIQNLFLGKWMWLRAHPLEKLPVTDQESVCVLFGSLHRTMYVCVVKPPRSFPDGWIFPEDLLAEDLELPRASREDRAGLRESSPFPRTSLKRELAGMDLTSHSHIKK